MISIKNLNKKFGRKHILHDIDLELENCTYGLLGPNGSGKTTLMRCIADIYPFTGEVSLFVAGNETPVPVSEHLGYLPQQFTMYKDLTVTEAMEYMATVKRIAGISGEQIAACLQKVNLEDRADAKVRTLSGGMLRRLGIAQALLGDPEIIIVDEPTAGLDPEERMRFKNIVRSIENNGTFIISTHILEDVEAVCDKIIVLHEGRVLGVFTPEELAALPMGKVYETEEKDVPADAVILRLSERHGKRYVRFLAKGETGGEPVETTLEDGYIYLIKGSGR